MPEEKFTPGPWLVHLDKRNGTVCAIIEDKSGDCVARTVYRFHRGERNANGHLITAAPDMYDILDKLSRTLSGVPVLQVEIEKVLKKARGEE